MSENLDLLFLIKEKEKARQKLAGGTIAGRGQKHSQLVDRVLGADTDTTLEAAGSDDFHFHSEKIVDFEVDQSPSTIDENAFILPGPDDPPDFDEDSRPATENHADPLPLPLDISDSFAIEQEQDAVDKAEDPENQNFDDPLTLAPPENSERTSAIESEIDAVLQEIKESLSGGPDPDEAEVVLDPEGPEDHTLILEQPAAETSPDAATLFRDTQASMSASGLETGDRDTGGVPSEAEAVEGADLVTDGIDPQLNVPEEAEDLAFILQQSASEANPGAAALFRDDQALAGELKIGASDGKADCPEVETVKSMDLLLDAVGEVDEVTEGTDPQPIVPEEAEELSFTLQQPASEANPDAAALFRDDLALAGSSELEIDSSGAQADCPEVEAVKSMDLLLDTVDEADKVTAEIDPQPNSAETPTDSGELTLDAVPDSGAAKPEKTGSAEESSPFKAFLSESGQHKLPDSSPTKKTSKKRPKKKPETRKDSRSFSWRSLFQNPRPLGLDIGSGAVKYVQFENSTRGPKLVNCGRASIPAITFETSTKERKEKIAAFLGKWFNASKFKGAFFASSISGMEVWFNHIRVPKMSGRDLTKAVPWACRKDLPFPLEATTLEFGQTGPQKAAVDNKLDMFVVAAQKDVVSDHVEMLAAAGILPAKVSTVPVALWHTFKFCTKNHTQKCYAIIDIGANSSHIVFVNNGELQFAREISTAGANFTEALTSPIFFDGREIQHDTAGAERIKRKYGVPNPQDDSNTADGVPLREVSVLMVPVLERLARDIQRTIDFYKEKFQITEIEKVLLSGGGALMPNLSDWLCKELATPVSLLNPLRGISLTKFKDSESLRKLGPRFAVAVGLALDRSKEFNLLPAHLRGSHTVLLAKRIFRYVFVILLLLMAFLHQDASREIGKLGSSFSKLNSEFKQSEPIRQRYLASQRALQELAQLQGDYQRSLNVDHRALQHLQAVSNYFPAKLTLSLLRTERREMSEKESEVITAHEFLLLEGVAFEDNSLEGLNLARFLLDLEGSDYFKSVFLKTQSVREDGSIQFSIECETYLDLI